MKKTIAIVGIIGAFTVGIAFAVISNSDDVKIRELISDYQIALNNEEIEKISILYSKQAIFMPPMRFSARQQRARRHLPAPRSVADDNTHPPLYPGCD